jgi:CubicO group peptidase (beta-lactamase class C family)
MTMRQYSARDFEPMFNFVARLVDSGYLPTGVLGIAQADGVVDLRAYGRRPDGRPVAPDDVFLLFSITKPFVALATVQLVERGLINLNHELRQYLPGFGADQPDSVLLWHLLTHTSGIDNGYLDFTNPRLLDAGAFRAALLDAPMRFSPGSHKQYNNLNYSYLRHVIQEMSGCDLEAYLQQNLLGPLGMRSTTFEATVRMPERVIPLQMLDPLDLDTLIRMQDPSVGLFSTAPDLLRLGRALLNGGALDGARILSPLMLHAMTTPWTEGIPTTVPNDFPFIDNEIGLTWMLPRHSKTIVAANGGTPVYGHNGAAGCFFWMFPEQDACFAFMTNVLNFTFRREALHRLHNVFAACL